MKVRSLSPSSFLFLNPALCFWLSHHKIASPNRQTLLLDIENESFFCPFHLLCLAGYFLIFVLLSFFASVSGEGNFFTQAHF